MNLVETLCVARSTRHIDLSGIERSVSFVLGPGQLRLLADRTKPNQRCSPKYCRTYLHLHSRRERQGRIETLPVLPKLLSGGIAMSFGQRVRRERCPSMCKMIAVNLLHPSEHRQILCGPPSPNCRRHLV